MTLSCNQVQSLINKWIQGILIYNFELVHVSATKFKGPDALSRIPIDQTLVVDYDDRWLDNLALYHITKTTIKESPCHHTYRTCLIINAVKVEATLLAIYEHLTNSSPISKSEEFLKKLGNYYLKAGKLFRQTLRGPPLLVILDKIKWTDLLTQAQKSLGHHDARATWENLWHKLYWPTMHKDVVYHVKSCHECQIRSTLKVHLPITISLPTIVFSKVHINVMYMPIARWYQYIVIGQDDLTKYIEGQALKKTTSQAITKFILEDLIYRYGCIGQIVTDNRPDFQEAFVQTLQYHGIPQISIFPYNSQVNEVVEQGHLAVREALVKACKGHISE